MNGQLGYPGFQAGDVMRSDRFWPKPNSRQRPLSPAGDLDTSTTTFRRRPITRFKNRKRASRAHLLLLHLPVPPQRVGTGRQPLPDFWIARQRFGFQQARPEIGMTQEAHLQALL